MDSVRQAIDPAELIERWTQGGRVLALMPQHERQNHWDMSAWGRRTQCGTVACAAGHCGMDPWFRERNFNLDIDQDGVAQISNVPGFFGIEGSARIFYDGSTRSVETVLGEIHAYVAEMQKMLALATAPGLPQIGEEWSEQGGIFAGALPGLDGAPDCFLIVGPQYAGHLDWRSGVDWAKSLSVAGHSDFALPTRVEGYPLFDRVPQLFERESYWLSEQHADCSSHAWNQHFFNGRQNYWYKTTKLRCRAVRRVPIQ